MSVTKNKKTETPLKKPTTYEEVLKFAFVAALKHSAAFGAASAPFFKMIVQKECERLGIKCPR